MAIPQTYGAYSPPRSREIDGRTVLAAVSLAAGALVALGGLTRRTLPGFLMTGLGGVLLFRGASHGPGLRRLLGRTGEAGEIQEEIDARGIEVSQNFLVNRSASDLYA